MKLKRHIPLLAAALAFALLPQLVGLLGMKYLLIQLTMSAFYVMVCLGLSLLMGYAGQISMGQAGFFAIGGYASALLSTAGLDPRLSLACAVALAGGVAFLIGMPVLRLKGHYLAMATLGFGVIVEKIVRGTPELGGSDGISSVPAFELIEGIGIAGGRSNREMSYYVAWAIVLLGVLLLSNLLNSRAGRALKAIHGSEEAAQAMGVDVARHKLGAFVLAAVFAAVAGSLLTHYNESIGPGEAGVMKSVRYVAIVAIGGMDRLWGSLLAGLVLNFLSLRGVFGVYDDAVFGLILVLVMLFSGEKARAKGRA
jgi:branched-chain amino acid transport system permease protein